MDNYYGQAQAAAPDYGQAYQNDSLELGWDDAIENDGPEYVIVEPGDYNFTVIGFERGRHTGSDKLPPCNKAILSIRIETPADTGECIIKHNLFLSKKTEGLLCAFFTSIGQRKHGERINMNWNAVVGSTGRCKIGKRKYTSKSGNEGESNEILRFYEPGEKAAAPERYTAPQTPQQPYAQQPQYAQPATLPSTGGYVPGKF